MNSSDISTLILSPFCMGLIILCIIQWQRLNESKNDINILKTEKSNLEKHLEDSSKQIEKSLAKERQSYKTETEGKNKQINELHSENVSLKHNLKNLENRLDRNRGQNRGQSGFSDLT